MVPKLSLRYIFVMLYTCCVIVLFVCISLCTSGACKNNWIHSKYGVNLCIVSSKFMMFTYYKLNNQADVCIQLFYSEKYSIVALY
jgi:hypothetical protein